MFLWWFLIQTVLEMCEPLGDQVRFAATSKECIALASIVVLTTPWPEFISIPAVEWARHEPPRVVVDCWRAVPHLAAADGIRYLPLGTGGAAREAPIALSIGSK